MFNGLIETRGDVSELRPIPAGFRIGVATPLAADLTLGESIAVNGVCLTVVEADAQGFQAEISPETVRVTALGRLQAGQVVNLERSMRADTRVGGHFVQGHVDAIGQIAAIRHEAGFHWVTVMFPPILAAYLVPKGSIAVDGISLTIAGLSEDRFVVQIVPFTWKHTNLSAAVVGAPVNLECDIIGKYVVRALQVGDYSANARAPEEHDG